MFHDAPPPAKPDLEELCRRVRARALRWLRKRGYLDERSAEDRGNDRRPPTAIEACTQLALAGGAFLARPFAPPPEGSDADLERKERRFSASSEGFDVHCAVRFAAADDASERAAGSVTPHSRDARGCSPWTSTPRRAHLWRPAGILTSACDFPLHLTRREVVGSLP